MIRIVEVNTENEQIYLDALCGIEEPSSSAPWSRRLFEEEVRNPLSRLWVALEGEAFSGYICFRSIGDEMELFKISVKPDRRQRGIGRRLLEEMISWGAPRGARSVRLEVGSANHAALRLYKGLGFTECGRRRSYYSPGDDAIIMSLSL
jgi:ribosomal-protein-alanine N-acetyltransferase